MTIASKPGELVTEADGAPMGVPMDITVTSASRPDRTYRIAREHRGDGQGILIHSPPCEAWQHGRVNCRHVREARDMAEDPAAWFIVHVGDLWRGGDNLTDRGRAEIATAIFRAREDVLNRLDELAAYRERMAERERVSKLRALMTDAERAEYDAARQREAVEVFA